MSKAVKKSVRTFMNRYPKWVCKREFESQSFKRFNERPVEFGFVFRKLSELYPRTILDVGTGTTALPHVMRNCGFLVTAGSPPSVCPQCNDSCGFKNVTCYTPECGGPGNIDPRL